MAAGLPTGRLPDRVLTRSNAGDPMIRYLVARITLLTTVATACGQSPEPTTRDAAASDAIAQARARAEDLANSNQNYQPVRFVSDIEKVRVPKPVRRPEPDTVVREGK